MLQTLVRGALAFFLALTGLVIATEAPAFACKCQAADADRQTRRSDVVFVGTVDKVTKQGKTYQYDVTATHTYKGTVDRETTVTSAAQAAACGLGELKVGKDYVFLARGAAPPYAASSCEGSGPANADRVTQLETLLGAGTAIEEPAPPTATRTRVEESAPGPFARLAAPGGALVLFGLLGLLVVGRLGKR
jgi:hypothetical protein